MESLFERLQLSQRSSMLRAVLLPPFASGMMWSYSSFSRLLHFTHFPPSLRQTSRRISEGIACRALSDSFLGSADDSRFRDSVAMSIVILSEEYLTCA